VLYLIDFNPSPAQGKTHVEKSVSAVIHLAYAVDAYQ